MKKWKLFFLGCFAVLCGFTIVAGNFVNKSRVASALTVDSTYAFDTGLIYSNNNYYSFSYTERGVIGQPSANVHNVQSTVFNMRFYDSDVLTVPRFYVTSSSTIYSDTSTNGTIYNVETDNSAVQLCYFTTVTTGDYNVVTSDVGQLDDKVYWINGSTSYSNYVVPFFFRETTTDAFANFSCNLVSVELEYVTPAWHIVSPGNYYQPYVDGALVPTSWQFSNYSVVDGGYTYNQCYFARYTFTDTNNNKVSMYVYTNDTMQGYTNYTVTEDGVYDSGYNKGYGDGLTYGTAQGSSTGYTSGYQAGYEVGKIAGASEANDYTFLSLIGAVIDAPINAFTSMFNLDILGVNLTNFFLGLFSIAVILFVVRKIRGGK